MTMERAPQALDNTNT